MSILEKEKQKNNKCLNKCEEIDFIYKPMNSDCYGQSSQFIMKFVAKLVNVLSNLNMNFTFQRTFKYVVEGKLYDFIKTIGMIDQIIPFVCYI